MTTDVEEARPRVVDPRAEREGVQFYHRPVRHQRVPPVARNRDKTPLAAQWWAEQLRRCKYGYYCEETGKYDTPAYYFHNNFLEYHIINAVTGETGYQAPLIRDSDRTVFEAFHSGQSAWKKINGQMKLKPARGRVFAKGRRAGFTTNGWGYTLHHFTHKQEWDVAHLYPDELTRNRENMRIRRMYARLHNAFKFDKDRHSLTLVTQNMDVLEQGYWVVNSDGSKTKVVVNRWYFAVASSDPGVLRGEKMGLIVIVEAGKWKNLKDVIRAQIDCLRQGSLWFGMLIVGGTSDTITNDSEDYKELYYTPETYEMEAIFLPPYRGREGFIDYKTGISNEKAALEDILQVYAKAAASGNPNDLLSRQQELPITPELCFIPPSKNEYDKTKLDQQFIYLLRNVKPDEFMYAEFVPEVTVGGRETGILKAREVINGGSQTGLWKLLRSALVDPEHNPGYEDLMADDEFVIGFDDVAKNLKAHEVNSWNSKGALVVINRRTKEIVGVYLDRPTRPELHRQAILAMKFWPGLTNYEYNDDVFYEALEKENMLHRVMYWSDKGWGPKDKPGMYAQGTIAEQTSHMQAAIARGDHLKWRYAEAITELKKWQSVNSDFTSAHHLANIGLTRLPDLRNKKPEGVQTWQPVVQFGSQSIHNPMATFGGGQNPAFFAFGTRKQ